MLCSLPTFRMRATSLSQHGPYSAPVVALRELTASTAAAAICIWLKGVRRCEIHCSLYNIKLGSTFQFKRNLALTKQPAGGPSSSIAHDSQLKLAPPIPGPIAEALPDSSRAERARSVLAEAASHGLHSDNRCANDVAERTADRSDATLAASSVRAAEERSGVARTALEADDPSGTERSARSSATADGAVSPHATSRGQRSMQSLLPCEESDHVSLNSQTVAKSQVLEGPSLDGEKGTFSEPPVSIRETGSVQVPPGAGFDVGMMVSVFWPGEERSFDATIMKLIVGLNGRRALVQYSDDGAQGWAMQMTSGSWEDVEDIPLDLSPMRGKAGKAQLLAEQKMLRSVQPQFWAPPKGCSADRGNDKDKPAAMSSAVDAALSPLAPMPMTPISDDDDVKLELLYSTARLFERLGQFDEAHEIYERALALKEKAVGGGHPSTAAALINLAALLESKVDDEAAQATYDRAERVQIMGDDHPPAAATRVNVGMDVSDEAQNKTEVDIESRPGWKDLLAGLIAEGAGCESGSETRSQPDRTSASGQDGLGSVGIVPIAPKARRPNGRGSIVIDAPLDLAMLLAANAAAGGSAPGSASGTERSARSSAVSDGALSPVGVAVLRSPSGSELSARVAGGSGTGPGAGVSKEGVFLAHISGSGFHGPFENVGLAPEEEVVYDSDFDSIGESSSESA